jgi:hypothetical protein
MQDMVITYDSISPVFRYDTGLLYGQSLPVIRRVMAKARGGVHVLTIAGLLQYLQNLITAATGNANAPTPFPWTATLQGLLDEGADKVNAVAAQEDQLAMLRQERDAKFDEIRASLVQYIAVVEGICGGDPVKLQSFGLALRSPASPPAPCDTVMGLVTSVGDDEMAMNGKWDRQPQADSYEVQISPDPITLTSWAHAETVSRAQVHLVGLPSGQKRWLRVRAVNAQGPGSWSDPSCRMIP